MLPGLVVVAFGLSLVVQQLVYPSLSWNRDEPVYLWHVEVLRAGQLAAPDGGHPDLFQPWLSAARDGELFSQYTLGWPLVLVLGSLLGSIGLAVAAGAALAVAGTWALVQELTADRRRGVAGRPPDARVADHRGAGRRLPQLPVHPRARAAVLRLPPSRRPRREHPGGWWAPGCCSGGSSSPAPSTPPCGGSSAPCRWWCASAIASAPSRARRRGARVGLLPLVAVTLLVNLRLTGSPTEFPITVADPLDRFGFGMRRLMPKFDDFKYGPRLASISTGRNAFWLPFFLIGAHLGVVVAAVGAWQRRRDGLRPPPRRPRAGLPDRLLHVLRHQHLVADRAAERTDLLRARLRRAVRPDRDRVWPPSVVDDRVSLPSWPRSSCS